MSGWLCLGVFLGWVLFAASGVQAHEQWIDVEDFYPGLGDTIEVRICSGHEFPKSAYVVKDNLLDTFIVREPGLSVISMESLPDGKQRAGMVVLDEEGVYVFSLTLKRPRAKKPAFEGKALVIVNPSKDDCGAYALGTGLELIPGTSISQLRAGGRLAVSLALDGTAIGGSLEVIPEKGRASFLRTEADRAAVIRIEKSGRYLVSAGTQGRACSLVFEVRGEGREEERIP